MREELRHEQDAATFNDEAVARSLHQSGIAGLRGFVAPSQVHGHRHTAGAAALGHAVTESSAPLPSMHVGNPSRVVTVVMDGMNIMVRHLTCLLQYAALTPCSPLFPALHRICRRGVGVPRSQTSRV